MYVAEPALNRNKMSNLSFCIIIPARYQSTRFPGKPLANIGNKTMIQRVYEAATLVKGAEGVMVATDHPLILNHVAEFGRVINTSAEHPSGTDRCYEAYFKSEINSSIVVNIQGDEPFIKPEQIEALVNLFQNDEVQIATLKKEIASTAEIEDPNIVKVATGKGGRALYFSRSVIPHNRDNNSEVKYYRHIGMYAYRASVLSEITKLPVSPLEHIEKLEQLRWLEAGYQIYVAETNWQSPAVDTPEDLMKAEEFLQSQN